jgi:hypothetical protein
VTPCDNNALFWFVKPSKLGKMFQFLSKKLGKMFQNGSILIGKSAKNICNLFISS